MNETNKTKISHNDIMDIEDTFQKAGVFFNGIRGKDSHCHMDSYMTCINFEILEQVWNTIVDKYLYDEWVWVSNYWEKHSYLSPVFSMLSSFVNQKIGVK